MESILWTYFGVGIAVVLYVFFRYGWYRRQPGDPFPWPERENRQQGLKLFLMVGAFNPILFFVQVALWPLWILYLWAFQPNKDNEDDGEG